MALHLKLQIAGTACPFSPGLQVVVLWFLWSFIVSCWITPIFLSLIGKGTEDLTLR